jgi:hypothetical protein
VSALAHARITSPGAPVGLDRLFAAGWPGDDADEQTRANRVRVALTWLRHAGLRDLLIRRREGYLFDPSIALRIEPG